MAEFIGERRRAGINRLQLKVGNNPLDDIARTRASVEAGDSETVIVADSNGGWSLAAAKLALQGPQRAAHLCRATLPQHGRLHSGASRIDHPAGARRIHYQP